MIPIPATLFLGYALLGGALFLFSLGMRTFLQASEPPLSTRTAMGQGHAAVLVRAVASLVVATLLLLAATITLMTAAARLLT